MPTRHTKLETLHMAKMPESGPKNETPHRPRSIGHLHRYAPPSPEGGMANNSINL